MIPNILHFVFFTPAKERKHLSLSHYLAVKSAVELNKPVTAWFHFNKEPQGEWWDKIKAIVSLNKMMAPASVAGQTLHHVAHQTDVVRLQVLKETGGIYMDIDTISVKPLTELLTQQFVIGQELNLPYSPKNKRQQIKYNIRKKLGLTQKMDNPAPGLCNAVLLAEKNSEFAGLWLNEYKTFRSKGRDKYWNEHSGKVPLKLAARYPQLVTLLGPAAFHYPLYRPQDLKMMFEEVHEFPGAYLHHLWESFSWEKYLSKLTVEKIKTEDTTYNLIARRFV